MDPEHTSTLVGKERYKADMRQLAALLVLLSLCLSVAPLNTIVRISSSNPSVDVFSNLSSTYQQDEDSLYTLVSAICETIVGLWGVMVGVMLLFTDRGNRLLTLSLMIVIQIAWIPFVLNMLNIIISTAVTPLSSNPFIPPIYDPTVKDVAFVGSMGILSVLVYTFSSVGSMALLGFAIFAYQCNRPNDRSAGFYRSRAWFYHGLVVFGGFSQMSIGSYLLSRFGGLVTEDDKSAMLQYPIRSGLYTVRVPAISVTVGVLQIMYGLVGYFRASSGKKFKRDIKYIVMAFTVWMCMVILQGLVQLSVRGGAGDNSGTVTTDADANGFSTQGTSGIGGGGYIVAQTAQTLACLYFGFAFMPAFLDVKIDTMPEHVKPRYYGGEVELLYADGEVSTRGDRDVVLGGGGDSTF